MLDGNQRRQASAVLLQSTYTPMCNDMCVHGFERGRACLLCARALVCATVCMQYKRCVMVLDSLCSTVLDMMQCRTLQHSTRLVATQCSMWQHRIAAFSSLCPPSLSGVSVLQRAAHYRRATAEPSTPRGAPRSRPRGRRSTTRARSARSHAPCASRTATSARR